MVETVKRPREERGKKEKKKDNSCFMVCLGGGVKKWEDEKLVGRWKSRRIANICVFGWRGGKVGGWKTLLFG